MLTVAVVQTPGVSMRNWRTTRDQLEQCVRDAAERGAQLVVLPECAWPAYFVESHEAYWRARAADLPGPDEFLQHLSQWARDCHVALCCGYVAESADRKLHNAAALFDADGELLGTRAKCFLWDFDNDVFEPGREILPLITHFGCIGIMICADARQPEIAATLAARGAQLILQPTAWVNAGTPDSLFNPQPAFLISDRAREFRVPIASASKWGVEGDTTFIGSSLIVDADGRTLARCGQRETAIAVAEVAPRTARGPRMTPTQRRTLTTPGPAQTSPAAGTLALRLLDPNGSATASADAPADSADAPADNVLYIHRPGQHESTTAHTGAPPTGTAGVVDGPHKGLHTTGAAAWTAVPARDVESFAPLRAMAFHGVHVAFVWNGTPPVTALRARAAENRIFVVHVGRDRVTVFDPRGFESASAHWPAGGHPDAGTPLPLAELDLSLAASKLFAPKTDAFAGRRPELYDFTEPLIAQS